MFDTLAIARQLAAAGLKPEQADAITDAVRRAAEHDASSIDTVTLATQTDLAGVEARLNARIAELETRLTWRLVGAMAAIGAVLRFLG